MAGKDPLTEKVLCQGLHISLCVFLSCFRNICDVLSFTRLKANFVGQYTCIYMCDYVFYTVIIMIVYLCVYV